MLIQKQKAADKNLEFNVKFKDIGGLDDKTKATSPIINCDEHRVMQVLLVLQANALKFTQKGKVETVVEIEKTE